MPDVDAYVAADASPSLPKVGASGPAGAGAVNSTRYQGNKSTEKPNIQDNYARNGFGRGERRRTKAQEERRNYECRKRRAMHSRLVETLASMATGEHGTLAKWWGERWAGEVRRCGGVTRLYKVCGKPSFWPHSCDFPLCPWYQHKRAGKAGARLGELWNRGFFKEPKFFTASPPNVRDLGAGWADLGAVLTKLHRRKVFSACRGGVRARETTISERHGDWNVHAHELLDSGWVSRFPQWNIEWRPFKRKSGGKWVVTQKHAGLGRESTKNTDRFGVLDRISI